MRILRSWVLSLSLLAGGATAVAQQAELLGQRQVSFAVERDTIPVGVANGVFRSIQLEVQGNGIEVYDLRVEFGNGAAQDIQVRQYVAAGQRTRVIDLNANRRFLRNVQVIYRTRGVQQGRATVRLFGFR